MFQTEEIAQLKTKLKASKNVYWRDADGVCHHVAGVNLKWVEDRNEPKLTEPVAVLTSGKVVALHNVGLAEFVIMQPLVLGSPDTPRLYVDRVLDALGLLCEGRKPPREMVEAWFMSDDHSLQDWAVCNAGVCWATGIGTIEAAIAMAETPEEGISNGNGKEHQTREEAFSS